MPADSAAHSIATLTTQITEFTCVSTYGLALPFRSHFVSSLPVTNSIGYVPPYCFTWNSGTATVRVFLPLPRGIRCDRLFHFLPSLYTRPAPTYIGAIPNANSQSYSR